MSGHKNFRILSDPIDTDPTRSERVEGLKHEYDTRKLFGFDPWPEWDAEEIRKNIQQRRFEEQPAWIKHYPLPVCELCGNIAEYIHCKIVCTVCGTRRDCSDP